MKIVTFKEIVTFTEIREMILYLKWLRNSFSEFLTKERNKQVMEHQ